MKLYKTTITAKSNFATVLKGDTLFGQLCWAINFAFGENRLEELLSTYETKPFLIVSDSFTQNYLPKPNLPSLLLGENNDDKKKNRKKIWLTLEELQNGEYIKAKTNEEVNCTDNFTNIVRNAINYKSFTTIGDGFDPYVQDEIIYSKKDIYFLIDESFTIDELKESFKLVSQMGYGKKTTIGKGRFEFSDFDEVNVNNNSNAFMTLSPSVLKESNCTNVFYEPFTRFGKHGSILTNTNPFKKPILLADSKAVICFEKEQELQYIGQSIKGHSSFKKTVHQGYSIVVAIKGFKDE